MIRSFLKKLKRGTEELNYGREIVVDYAVAHAARTLQQSYRILDLGLAEGTDVKNIRDALKQSGISCEMYGVECYEEYAEKARAAGITVAALDIERDKLPWPDAYFDIVVANQIIEHTKEIFWIFSEVSRVMKPSGICIVGVPNLAAAHNRVALLFGNQPTCIEMLSAHVRGICVDSFRRFIECEGFFRLGRVRGSNFYPFPPFLSRSLSRAFPRASVCSFFEVIRTKKPGTFIEVLESRFFETPFYVGRPIIEVKY